jgi:SPP1 gp7 family putative phage head morphogenesis protein
VFQDLKGITATMDTQISRILAQGMVDGDGPRLIARKLLSTINGTGTGELGITDTLGRFIPARRRAEMLARTEIIRAHHLATIAEYRNWGVLGISVKGEWRTAGDSRVCEKCQQLEGKVFTLDEIEPMIPLHISCRCIALPYIEELKKYE